MPEAFLTLIFSVKLKDDDMRKQRVKMEAQASRAANVMSLTLKLQTSVQKNQARTIDFGGQEY